MALMKLSKYRELAYAPGSRPCMNTLRKNIHKIPGGQVIDGHFWVDMDENDRQTNMRAGILASQRELAKDPRLSGLI